MKEWTFKKTDKKAYARQEQARAEMQIQDITLLDQLGMIEGK